MQVTVIEEVALTAGCSRFDARFVLATEALSTTATAAGHSEASSHRHWITRRPPDGAAGSCADIFGVLPPGGVRGGAPPGWPMGAGFLTGGQGPAERRSGLPLVAGALPDRQGVALRSACHPPIDPQILPKSQTIWPPQQNLWVISGSGKFPS
jgi:hypothetical protein